MDAVWKHVLFLPSILPPNRGPLDCAGGTLQEEMKVMFEFLGKTLWLSWQQTAKVPQSTKRDCSFNKHFWHIWIAALTSYSHILHILPSHFLLAVDTVEQYDTVVQLRGKSTRCADAAQGSRSLLKNNCLC